MEERFYMCSSCGNVLFTAIASGITPHCCGKEMTLLHSNLEEGNGEKHLPVVDCKGNGLIGVRIGSVLHPMTEDHSIRFICVKTTLGYVIRYLNCNEEPDVTIRCNGKPLSVYAYCNKHGLWRKDLDPPQEPKCSNVI